jgi:hypothetical protein
MESVYRQVTLFALEKAKKTENVKIVGNSTAAREAWILKASSKVIGQGALALDTCGGQHYCAYIGGPELSPSK